MRCSRLFLLISLGVLITALSAAAQQARFDEANLLLEENRYADALNIYKTIADEGHRSGALWLNMGISYVRLDSLGMGKYYFLKAKQFPETSENAEQALGFVNNRFSRQSAVLPELPWMRFLNTIQQGIGLTTLVLLSLLFLYAGCALIIGSWFRVDLRKLFRLSGTAALGFSALLLTLSIIINYQEIRYGTGVMVDRQAVVYQNPNKQSPTVSTAYEGYTMRVDFTESSEKEGWLYIRLENGMYGWIQSDVIRIV